MVLHVSLVYIRVHRTLLTLMPVESVRDSSRPDMMKTLRIYTLLRSARVTKLFTRGKPEKTNGRVNLSEIVFICDIEHRPCQKRLLHLRLVD